MGACSSKHAVTVQFPPHVTDNDKLNVAESEQAPSKEETERVVVNKQEPSSPRAEGEMAPAVMDQAASKLAQQVRVKRSYSCFAVSCVQSFDPRACGHSLIKTHTAAIEQPVTQKPGAG